MVSEALHDELQKQHREVAELHGHLVKNSVSSNTAEYEYPLSWQEQQQAYSDSQHQSYSEAYGPYFGEDGEEETLKASSQPRGKRLAAVCCIIFLAALAVGSVVLFVKRT